MKVLYKICLLFLTTLVWSSCGKWVDVKPSDRLGEDQLFKDHAGYLKALNGVYVELTSPDVYGENLTAGALDVLAQYYFLNLSTHKFYNLTTFVYTDANVMNTFDRIWSKTFELITNCNVILEKCGDAPSSALPEPYYSLVKGETLALRAFLHFDMMRLFGPIYGPATENLEAIPYATQAVAGIHPILTAREVMEKVTADLNQALELLGSVDPIRTEGVRHQNNTSGSNDFHYRQYRLNYYAAKAVLARAYLWQKQSVEALNTTESLLAEVESPQQNTFPLVTFANATHTERPDRLFSTEVMFALYKMDRKDLFNVLFDVNLPTNTKLSFSAGDVNELRVQAVYDDANDFRRRVWQSASNGTTTATTNMKYADIVDAPGRYMVPLVRLSELYLIAAECHPDMSTRIAYLNRLRNARNAVSLNPVDEAALLSEIGKEYRREMLGEGQLFFYYKRMARSSVPTHATAAGTPEKVMVLDNYVIPLPESEMQYRQ